MTLVDDGETALDHPRPRRAARSAVPVWLTRIGYEVVGYFRQADTVFFTFLFPVMLFVIFSTIFPGDISPQGILADPAASGVLISQPTYYLPGLVAAGILVSGVQNLATDIAREKYNGMLKRLGGTPMSPVTYFVGKIGQAFVTACCQCALLLAVAHIGFGVPLPTGSARWFTFAWVFVLGFIGCALAGVAMSSIPRSGSSATAVVMPIVLILQFISGIYVPDFQLPESVQRVAALFPLAWLARGMRAVFLPDEFAVLERGGTWGMEQAAVALLAWLLVGFVVARLTFRWIRRDA